LSNENKQPSLGRVRCQFVQTAELPCAEWILLRGQDSDSTGDIDKEPLMGKKCTLCTQFFCFRHRHPNDHACAGAVAAAQSRAQRGEEKREMIQKTLEKHGFTMRDGAHMPSPSSRQPDNSDHSSARHEAPSNAEKSIHVDDHP
jgi:hypothetical protein